MVENVIYYYSGTGNTLSVAKSIAEKLELTTLVSMKCSPYDVRMKATERVGFVFPVYYLGMPRIVEEFMKKIVLPENIYIFVIVTYGGMVGNALKQAESILEKREYHLSYSAKIKSVGNNIMLYDISKKKQKILASALVQTKTLIEDLVSMTKNDVGIQNPLIELYYNYKMRLSTCKDMEFEVTRSCTHCGLCYQICQGNNIELVDGMPTFRHKCQQCMACIQFCPVQAINYKKITCSRERYHHPEIKPQDLMESQFVYGKNRLNPSLDK